tara:strand:- start:1551 stop:2690 length:1140 start_codon:yes stop_codon:yes gene_type:complete
MRDLLNKLTLFESTQEGFDPEEFKGEIEDFEVSGDDGEPEGADIHYTAKIVDGKPVVDPKSIEVHAYGNNPSSKLGYDVENDTDMIMNYGGVDAEEILRSAQEDAEEQWAERDNKYSQGEDIVDDTTDEATDEEIEVPDEMRGQISDWIDKFSKYKGGNGDTLPEGYMQWALNSGIATDFYEQNEIDAFNKMKGYDADSNDGEWTDEDHDDFTDNKSGASPITSACLKMLNKITGDDFIEDNANIIDAVMHGDGNESAELSDIKQLSGLDTNEEDEQTFEGEEFYEYYGYLPWHEDIVDEAEYQGRKVKLGKPMQGDVKKFKVYVRDPKTKNVKKVNFGDPNMRIKKSNPKRRKSFRARHNCDNPGPRTKARYWSCRKW